MHSFDRQFAIRRIEIEYNLIEFMCFSLTCSKSVWSVTHDVFWYGMKGALEILLRSHRKGHNTKKRIDRMERNQHRLHKTMPIIRNGNLMDQRYVDEILRFLVVPYAAAISDPFFKYEIIPDLIQLDLWKT